MGPIRLYEVFSAMRLHWTNTGYDFVKFKGRVKNLDQITLMKSKDKSIYYQVAEKYKIEKDFVMTILPLFIEDQRTHISTLLGNDFCTSKANEWYMKIQRMPRFFADDCDTINKFIKDNDLSHQQFFLGNYILDFLLYDKIEMETFIILNQFIKFLSKNKLDTVVYRQMYKPIVDNYASFIHVDLDKYKQIFEKSIIKYKK